MRVSVWHTSLLSEDILLGQVNLSLGSLTQATNHTAWYMLSSRPTVAGQTPKQDLGQMRLKVTYSRDYIFPRMTYEPMIGLLQDSLTSPVRERGRIIVQFLSLSLSELCSVFDRFDCLHFE